MPKKPTIAGLTVQASTILDLLAENGPVHYIVAERIFPGQGHYAVGPTRRNDKLPRQVCLSLLEAGLITRGKLRQTGDVEWVTYTITERGKAAVVARTISPRSTAQGLLFP